MRNSFPTREQLSGMSLNQLRLIDVQEKDEEDLLQEIISLKVAAIPPVAEVFRGDFPDIVTPEQEENYQKIVDERAGIVKLETTVEEKVEEIKSPEPIVKENKCPQCSKVVKTAAGLRIHIGKFHKK